MTEKQLQQAILDCARHLGWLAYHTHDSRHSAAGFPDLLMLRGPRLVFAELKTETGRLSHEQQAWLDAFSSVARSLYARDPAAGFDGFVWRPKDWTSGEVEAVLR
jgi:hypothetical protein